MSDGELDVRHAPVGETGVVHLGSTPGEQYGWECAECDASTGLPFGSSHDAEADLERHLASPEHRQLGSLLEEKPWSN